jgi:hypothetical protein
MVRSSATTKCTESVVADRQADCVGSDRRDGTCNTRRSVTGGAVLPVLWHRFATTPRYAQALGPIAFALLLATCGERAAPVAPKAIHAAPDLDGLRRWSETATRPMSFLRGGFPNRSELEAIRALGESEYASEKSRTTVEAMDSLFPSGGLGTAPKTALRELFEDLARRRWRIHVRYLTRVRTLECDDIDAPAFESRFRTLRSEWQRDVVRAGHGVSSRVHEIIRSHRIPDDVSADLEQILSMDR